MSEGQGFAVTETEVRAAHAGDQIGKEAFASGMRDLLCAYPRWGSDSRDVAAKMELYWRRLGPLLTERTWRILVALTLDRSHEMPTICQLRSELQADVLGLPYYELDEIRHKQKLGEDARELIEKAREQHLARLEQELHLGGEAEPQGPSVLDLTVDLFRGRRALGGKHE